MSNDNPLDPTRRGQLELFAGEASASRVPDAEQMRRLLGEILAEAKAASIMPWPAAKAHLYRLMFPQLTFWLPEEEAAQLRFEFETELLRLQVA